MAQGDILERSEELVGLLRRFHRHFLDPKFLAFVVVTQSCDLVRNQKRSCKASHISLAVVRSLDDVLEEYLVQNCIATGFPRGVLIEEQRSKAEQFLERLLNQNEQALGLFYLYPEADAGIDDHAVAKLRVTISFENEHYEVFQRARVGRLASEFCSKLGWLKGNLYSRVATTDWKETELRREEYKSLVKKFLGSEGTKPRWRWLPRTYINQAKTDQVSFDGMNLDECAAEIRKHIPLTHRKRAIARVEEIAHKVFGPTEQAKIAEVTRQLETDLRFEQSCKQG